MLLGKVFSVDQRFVDFQAELILGLEELFDSIHKIADGCLLEFVQQLLELVLRVGDLVDLSELLQGLSQVFLESWQLCENGSV